MLLCGLYFGVVGEGEGEEVLGGDWVRVVRRRREKIMVVRGG